MQQLKTELEQRAQQRTSQREIANHGRVHARDAALAVNRAKRVFLANKSHEIRTPMNAMLSRANLLRRGGLTPPQAYRLAHIDATAQHLLQIINDLLDLSKIEAEKRTLDAAPLAVDLSVRHVGSRVADRAKAKGLLLPVELCALPDGLLGDATWLRKALLNCATNAIKFTESGTVTLRLVVQILLKEAGLLVQTAGDGGQAIECAARQPTDLVVRDMQMPRLDGRAGSTPSPSRSIPRRCLAPC